MAAKKTIKFKTAEEFNSDIAFGDNDNIASDDFNSEKELSNYLKNNIEIFTDQYLNDICVSFNFNHSVNYNRHPYRTKRVDLIIEGKKKYYVIELKNPQYARENISAIGPLLDYGRHIDDNNNKLETQLVLLSSMYDVDTALTIQKYNLPIRYFYLQKEFAFEAPKYGSEKAK